MKKILFLVFLFFVFQNVQAESQKVSQAYQSHLIERVREIFSMREPKLEHPLCATPIFLEVKANWDKLSTRTRKMLKSYIGRPTFNFSEYTYDTPQGHFKIHYTREGDSAVYQPDVDDNFNGHPDWVDTVGMVLEHVWEKEIDNLGFKQPPDDGWYPDTGSNGGDERYDVYLLNLGSDFLGYTQEEQFLPSPSFSATSYIVLDNDYVGYGSRHSRREWLEVTFAHEFFHAIQMGYDGTEYAHEDETPKFYWMEMSAVWMEEMVYDNINDYLGYLSSFFNHPEWSLTTFSLERIMPDSAYHSYGSCVWPLYLSERVYPKVPAGFDTSIIKEIWEECAKVQGNNAIAYPNGPSATDIALERRGTTFEEVFREFTVWNYFTGARARTQLFYSEGDLFPEIEVQASHPPPDYPIYFPSGANPPHGLGSNYIIFKPKEERGGVKLSFSPASEEYDFELSAIGYNKEVYQPVSHQFQINHQTGSAETDVYDWTFYNEIILIPAAVSRDGNSYFPYTYSAEYDSSLHGEHPFPEGDWIGQNFPNPFIIRSPSDSTYFPFILSSVSRVEINVFTVSGELVWYYPPPEKEDEEWTIGEYTKRGRCPGWDGKNQKGEYVSSGVYLFQVKTKNSAVIKKMAVIK